DRLARFFCAQTDKRRLAVEIKLAQNIDIGVLVVSNDLYILDCKTERGSSRLDHLRRVTANRHAIKAGSTEETQHADSASMARNINIALEKADGKAERLAQEARQDKSSTHHPRCIPHRARAPISVR